MLAMSPTLNLGGKEECLKTILPVLGISQVKKMQFGAKYGIISLGKSKICNDFNNGGN